ncbi:hypothetical protein [Nocardia brasiliensis]|uniref:hypothetical protein n=1 Tax=Nocardia brasiliensis TaxID=37326 RepID=UPI0004A6D13E|nr:hypothetical protein [Nocardia brasiliensis]
MSSTISGDPPAGEQFSLGLPDAEAFLDGDETDRDGDRAEAEIADGGRGSNDPTALNERPGAVRTSTVGR